MTNSEKRTLTDKFMLRLPDGMRDRIKYAAERNNRSMNAEILATLESAYPIPMPVSNIEILRAFLKSDGETKSVLLDVMKRTATENGRVTDPDQSEFIKVLEALTQAKSDDEVSDLENKLDEALANLQIRGVL